MFSNSGVTGVTLLVLSTCSELVLSLLTEPAVLLLLGKKSVLQLCRENILSLVLVWINLIKMFPADSVVIGSPITIMYMCYTISAEYVRR